MTRGVITRVLLFFLLAPLCAFSDELNRYNDPDEYFDNFRNEETFQFSGGARDSLGWANFSQGRVTTSVGTGDSAARVIAVGTNGKILLVGRYYDGTINQFGVARYHVNGSLDTSFLTNGQGYFNVTTGDNYAHAVVLQTNGKFVVLGRGKTGTHL